ncbi:CHRD domain-containing protein [Spirosoma flavum]|uniref:CHRD domain-containing protein n=1 Tax=Spirosoma flavum TaxID=2048557 RepID=A0ABW6AI21_9BACT
MKKKNTLLSLTALLALGLTLTSCSNDENPTITDTTTRLTATMNGANEKPTSTSSTATGTFVGDLNTTTRVLSYTVTYQGFSEALTGGHLHRITAVNGTGPVDIPFPSLTNPIIATTAVLPQSKVDSLLAGQYYANLHTKTYPSGEIRGEVRKQ